MKSSQGGNGESGGCNEEELRCGQAPKSGVFQGGLGLAGHMEPEDGPPSKKLDNKRAGPFAIKEKVGPAGYQLKLPQAWRIHRVFNELLLTPYVPPSFP